MLPILSDNMLMPSNLSVMSVSLFEDRFGGVGGLKNEGLKASVSSMTVGVSGATDDGSREKKLLTFETLSSVLLIRDAAGAEGSG